jgi:hypothetical protein
MTADQLERINKAAEQTVVLLQAIKTAADEAANSLDTLADAQGRVNARQIVNLETVVWQAMEKALRGKRK